MELIKRSLVIYEVIVNHNLNNGKIILIDKDNNEKELVIH
jgi:hypothetical protein